MLAGSHCTEHTTTTAASLAIFVNHCLRQLPSHLRPPNIMQIKASGISRSSPVQMFFELPCLAVRGVITLIPWQHLIPASFPVEILRMLHLLQNHSIIKKKGLMQVCNNLLLVNCFIISLSVFFKPWSLRS